VETPPFIKAEDYVQSDLATVLKNKLNTIISQMAEKASLRADSKNLCFAPGIMPLICSKLGLGIIINYALYYPFCKNLVTNIISSM